MNKLKSKIIMLLAFIIALEISGCSKPGCTDPAATNYDPKANESDGSCKYAPPCEQNNTARVKFVNNSTSNSTYTVVWDGAVVETLYPFTESDYFTVAGGSHTLTFKISNNGSIACTPANPVIVQCQDRTFSCSN